MSNHKIVYRYMDSPLGTLIIGTTSKGCCLLEFSDRHSLTDINSRYNKWYKMNCVEGTQSTLDKLEDELKDYFERNLHSFSVPLDLRGTTFEISVWKELQKIPYGETRSYIDIARVIGNPSASRAVGRANGNNPVAIVVPCHRVIASNGTLHGYGGGLWRKEKLLALESRKKSLTEFM
ncbi:MAG: methylated-DNA--[protein]-cysteine S-methyltransferase [Candidatus Hodarchaeota archaeon]